MKRGGPAADAVSFGVDDDPEYRPARERVDRLREKQSALRQQIEVLVQARNEPDRRALVLAVLDGADPKAAQREDPAEKISDLREQISIVESALRMAEVAERTAFSQALKRYRERVLPEFRAVSAAMASALIALGEAQELAMTFQSTLDAAGAGDWPASAGPLGVSRLGAPTHRQSVWGCWLLAAVNAGAIEPAAVPQRWLDSWGGLPTGTAAIHLSRDAADVSLATRRVRAGARARLGPPVR